jgi:hypothetical protein
VIWENRGCSIKVEDHSFFTAGPEVELAVPYGVYDLTADAGWVGVGVDHGSSADRVARGTPLPSRRGGPLGRAGIADPPWRRARAGTTVPATVVADRGQH